MKKLHLYFIALVGLLALYSCEKSEFGPVMNSDPGSPAITAPESGQSYSLTEDQADDTLLTMTWTAPDYGFASAPSYTVEMGLPGDNFENPITLGTVNKTSYALTFKGMNNVLLANGFLPNQQANAEFRVTASVSDSVEQQVSEPVSLAFTPYEVIITYPSVYVPGGYQSSSGYTNDWSPADAPALQSVNSDDRYEGYVYMANSDNEFKFTKERTWDTNWGDNGPDGTLDQDGSNIVLANSGYYKINVNLNDMTYSTMNTTWGVIGSATATGWDADMDMTYDPNTKVWTITTDLTADEIKFRANNDWNLNYGDTGADGKLDVGGDNIAISEAGNYTITLDLSKHPYSYTLTKN